MLVHSHYCLPGIHRYVILFRLIRASLTFHQSTIYALAEKIADDIKRSR